VKGRRFSLDDAANVVTYQLGLGAIRVPTEHARVSKVVPLGGGWVRSGKDQVENLHLEMTVQGPEGIEESIRVVLTYSTPLE
jgi:hypothetical protein